MGCDIHLYVEQKFVLEKRKKGKVVSKEIMPGTGVIGQTYVPGKIIKEYPYWRCMDKWKINPYWMYDEIVSKRHSKADKEFYHEDLYHGRNYYVFGILAGVRESDMPLIHPPKGLPHDASLHVKKFWRDWEGARHTPSWLTLRELKEFDWSQKVTIRGMVSPETKENLDKGISPESWCAWTSVAGWVSAEWHETAKHMCRHFLDAVMPELERLAEEACNWVGEGKDRRREEPKEHYDDIRIVFWFDN